MQTLPWTNGVKDEIGFPVPLRQNGIKSESRWTIVHFKIIESSVRLTMILSTIIKKLKINNKRRTIQKNIEAILRTANNIVTLITYFFLLL